MLTNSPLQVYYDSKGQLGTVYASKRFQDKLYVASNRGLFFRSFDNPDEKFKSIPGLSGQNWNLEIVNDVLFVVMTEVHLLKWEDCHTNRFLYWGLGASKCQSQHHFGWRLRWSSCVESHQWCLEICL